MALPISIFVTSDSADANAPRRDGVAVSGTDTYYSKMWSGDDSASYSLQVSWTGTPTGTITLQVSDTPNPDESSDDDWETSTEITVSSPAGSASGFLDSTTASPTSKKRLKYVNASGSGTLTGYVSVLHGVG